jgi:glycosyltransferase involved in cell wall biosynthesis
MTDIENPLVSVILPVFNGEDYLSESMDSILNQSYTNFEVIVVNDASTDNTQKILDTYDDPRIKMIVNATNLKLPKSLNIGFNRATGKLHTWTSHDNVMEFDFLETLVRQIQMTGADFIYTNYKIINSQGEYVGTAKVEDPENLVAGNCIGASFCYKDEIFHNLSGYSEDKYLYEDFDFWVRCYQAGYKMKYVNASPYKYRLHRSQLSSTQTLPEAFLKYRFNLVLNERQVAKEIRMNAFGNMATLFFTNRKYLKTFHVLLRMFLINPRLASEILVTKARKLL